MAIIIILHTFLRLAPTRPIRRSFLLYFGSDCGAFYTCICSQYHLLYVEKASLFDALSNTRSGLPKSWKMEVFLFVPVVIKIGHKMAAEPHVSESIISNLYIGETGRGAAGTCMRTCH